MPQDRTTESLLQLLRCAVFGKALPPDFSLSGEEWKTVRTLAKRHDLLHLVEYAAKTDASGQCFGSEAMDSAVFRYLQQQSVIEKMETAFEAFLIPYIPLKGTVLCSYYPEPWMRTSADIDILVKKSDYHTAITVLQKCGFSFRGESPHEAHFSSSEGVAIELHHALILPNAFPIAAFELSAVWDRADASASGSYAHKMSDTDFYLYHIAHMAKHLKNGGCGIRFFLDLQLMLQRPEHDRKHCHELAEHCGLLPFALAAEHLAQAWFSSENCNAEEHLAQYVLSGGVFGSMEHAVASSRSSGRSRMGHLIYRLFPPYSRMKYEYPVLQKRACLLPLIWLRRWFTLQNSEKRKQAMKELRSSRNMDKESIIQYTSLLEELGLHRAMKKLNSHQG